MEKGKNCSDELERKMEKEREREESERIYDFTMKQLLVSESFQIRVEWHTSGIL